MKKNVASQSIGAEMVTAADGSAFTGTVTVYVTGDAGTQALGSVGSGVCTHEGNGYHTYAPAQAETNYDLIAFTFIGTGAIPATVQVYTTFPQTGDNFARIGSTGAGLTTLAQASVCTDDRLKNLSGASALESVTEVRLAELDAANLPTDIAAIPTTAMRGTDSAALASVCTDDRLKNLSGASALVSVSEARLANLSGAASLDDIKAAIDTDTIAELGVGIPATTPTLKSALMLLYMALRNKMDNDASFSEIHNNAGTIVAKAALTSTSAIFTRAKLQSG